jgi:hypothetical protein
MKNFLSFFSLTVANQLCSVIAQLVLLPLMLRTWGHEVAAQWFVAVALANLTGVFDFGLHNAGHSQLLAGLNGDAKAATEFRHTWLLTRLTIVGMSVLFIVYQLLLGSEFFALSSIMICSMAIDTILGARGIWFDTLGQFNRVESSFLATAILRIVVALAALVFFQASPITIAWIMLAISLSGIVVSWALLRSPLLGFLAGGFAGLSWRSLSVIRLVVADPLSGWVRTSLPVVVFAAIAPASVVTTYVAMRAVFGLSRQVIWQLTRYASVRYIQHYENNKKWAEHIVMRAIQGTIVIGVAVSSVVIVDQGRLVRLWLGFTSSDEYAIVASFAFGTIAFGYTVIANILMRTGDVAAVAKRQYLYLLAAVSVAVVTQFIYADTTVYLVMLALQEVLIAGLFVTSLGKPIMQTSIVGFLIGAAMLCLTTMLVQFVPNDSMPLPVDLAMNLGVTGVMTILTLIALYAVEYFPSRNRPALSRI